MADTKLFEAELESAAWQPVDVESAGTWGVHDVARLDDEHLVVKTEKALELLVREGSSGWRAQHRVTVPADATCVSSHQHGCSALITMGAVRLYSVHRKKLKKLHDLSLPRERFRAGLLPTGRFDTEGNLRVSSGRTHLVRIASNAVRE